MVDPGNLVAKGMKPHSIVIERYECGHKFHRSRLRSEVSSLSRTEYTQGKRGENQQGRVIKSSEIW